jgi:hypothetical protein
MSALTPDSFLVVSSDVVSQELEGELVLLSLDRAQYFGLNTTGTHVWNAMLEGRRLHDAARQLAEQFGIELDRAIADVLALAESLVNERLATAAGGDR